MSTRTDFPAKAPEHLCPGMWLQTGRNGIIRTIKQQDKVVDVTEWVRGWAPCEMPRGHVTPECGPRYIFDAEVRQLGPHACHVVT